MRFSDLLSICLIWYVLIIGLPAFSQNYALKYDGIDDYVLIEFLSPILNVPINQFTFEFWINFNGLTGNTQQVMEGNTSTGEIFFETDGNDTDIWFHISDNTGASHEISITPLPLNTWFFISGTYDGNIQCIYLNGILQESLYWNNNFTIITGITLGKDFGNNSQYLNGQIDEVRVWNTVLTQSEIQANMYRKVMNYEPDLIGYWSFNEGVGNTAYDYSGNANHGVIHGASWIPSSAPTGLSFFFANPNIAYQNHLLSTTFKGTNTHFADSSGTSNVWLVCGDTTIFPQNFAVHSNTVLDAVFFIPADIPLGFWDIKIETALDSVITMNNGLEILTPPALFFQNSGSLDWLKGITAYDESHAWAVGNQGTISSTTNGGENWPLQNSGTTNTLNAICFTDINSGWTVGQLGLILHSSDGGNSWQAQNSGTTNNLQSVFFIDANTGWTVGSNGTVLKTMDGGSSWSGQNSGITSWLYAVCFVDTDHGWAAGSNGTIMHTKDGGSSWIVQNSGTSQYLFSLDFTDTTNGWAAGSGGTILHTTDGGEDWILQSSGTSSWLRSVHFMNADTGFAVGNSGTWLMSTDGGGVWESRRSMTGNTLNCICFADQNTGWIVGEAGTISKLTFQSQLTSIDNEMIAKLPVPEQIQLLQNYPNPFNPTTTIDYRLPNRSKVILKVYNLLGQEIRTLLNRYQVAGEYQVVWDGKDSFTHRVSSGIYIYTLQADNYFVSRKMLFLK